MKTEGEFQCRDFGDNPDCLKDPDATYTMFFSDIGKLPIYWCSHCGPIAEAMMVALFSDAAMKDPTLMVRLEEAIRKAEAENRAKQS